jgi:hypothetical protein
MPRPINISCSASKICHRSRIYNAGGQKTLNLSPRTGVTPATSQCNKENLMQAQTKTKTIVTALSAAIMFASVSTSLAAGAGNSLGDCYNHVISACNQTAHPIPCSNSGMDACDEEHSASINTNDINKLRTPKSKKKRNPTIMLQSIR